MTVSPKQSAADGSSHDTQASGYPLEYPHHGPAGARPETTTQHPSAGRTGPALHGGWARQRPAHT